MIVYYDPIYGARHGEYILKVEYRKTFKHNMLDNRIFDFHLMDDDFRLLALVVKGNNGVIYLAPNSWKLISEHIIKAKVREVTEN